MMAQDQPPGSAVPPEWHEWRGGVNEKLNHITEKQDTLEIKVDRNSDTLSKMPADIEERFKRVINGEAGNPQRAPNAITFKWLTEKMLIPILLALGGIVLGYFVATGG